jgi:hypothetical protein
MIYNLDVRTWMDAVLRTGLKEKEKVQALEEEVRRLKEKVEAGAGGRGALSGEGGEDNEKEGK